MQENKRKILITFDFIRVNKRDHLNVIVLWCHLFLKCTDQYEGFNIRRLVVLGNYLSLSA
jgi:hypothetical protein